MNKIVHPLFLLLLLMVATGSHATDNEERRNWFHDPFFRISNKIKNCPIPTGPFVTKEQKMAEAHHRAERGTTCWLAGKCDRPTSYDYDKDIASALQGRLALENPFEESTLWITVQGRVVYIEGCVADRDLSGRIEKYVMEIPYVEIAVAHLSSDPAEPIPYPVLKP